MGSQKMLRIVVGSLCVQCLMLSAFCCAQTEISTWQCLPRETVGAIRVPNGRAVIDALRETKLGTVMLSEKRKTDIVAVCEKYGKEEWGEFLDTLKQYELTTDELVQLFAGETGYAIELIRDADDEPRFLGLGWAQPGDTLAAKFFEVIGKAIDEQDDEHAVERTDLEVAGQSVMQLRFPVVDLEYTAEFELPDDYEDMSEDEQDEAYERAAEKHEASAVETIRYRTALICRLNDRLIVAHQFVASDDDDVEATDELLNDLLGRLLTSHADGGSDGFVPRLASDPGVARTMSHEGVAIMEMLGDIQPLIAAAVSKADDEAEAEKWIGLLGVEKLGAFALRQTADGTNWHTHMSLSLPAPRMGLMKLLDQEMLAIDPPQWVPASAVRYFQLSFDLGEAYNTIKEEVTRAFPDETSAGFEMAETQVRNFAQVSLPELLSSLGNRHTIMSFGVEAYNAEADDDSEVSEDMTDRMAVVWQVTDEQLWAKLFKVLGPFAGMAPGTEPAEEQGFSGYRTKNGALEGGLFLGKGYLVFGVGSGVVESTLAALNNPPRGADAFRGSEVYETAAELVDLEPAMFVEITDNERYLRMVMSNLDKQFSQFESMMRAMGDDDEASEGLFAFDLLRAILPSDDELEGLLGVSVGLWERNDNGFQAESVQEMPSL